VNLYINNVKQWEVNGWGQTTNSSPVSLTAGLHDLVSLMYENEGG
jgi:hypothetical protein